MAPFFTGASQFFIDEKFECADLFKSVKKYKGADLIKFAKNMNVLI